MTYRLRGGAKSEVLEVAHLVNCTGPQSDIRRLAEPFFVNLRNRGLLQPDKFGLGVQTDGYFAPMDVRGMPVPRLRVIGPMLKADLFESTAVPELRAHAEQLAIALLARDEIGTESAGPYPRPTSRRQIPLVFDTASRSIDECVQEMPALLSERGRLR